MSGKRRRTRARPRRVYDTIVFDVWGARGSRSLSPPLSRIANYTSCYSVRGGADLFVLDGGRGLGVLSHALSMERRFQGIERIHLFLSHSHLDHWEGLKDASWFWTNRNGLRLSVLGTREAIETLHQGYRHPAYVPLEVLAARTLSGLDFRILGKGSRFRIRGWAIETFSLNHYSGAGASKNVLDTLGFRMRSPEGFVLAYLCDHEPTPATETEERRALEGAHVAVVDAHFADRSQHAFGHGSQEHAAALARRHPSTLVLAAHHGPAQHDREIRSARRRHGSGIANYRLAIEGLSLRWSAKTREFSRQ